MVSGRSYLVARRPLREVLRYEQAENVDREAITVEGEGPELEIVVIPHRDLGGLSLVVVNDEFETYLRWADIGAYFHEDVDMATQAGRLTHLGEWRTA